MTKTLFKSFSLQNNMVMSSATEELQGLTLIEGMCKAHYFPVISVYTKPGGQKAYKGHCISFSQDIQQLCDILPKYPVELPIQVVSVKGKENTCTSNDLIVCMKMFHMCFTG